MAREGTEKLQRVKEKGRERDAEEKIRDLERERKSRGGER